MNKILVFDTEGIRSGLCYDLGAAATDRGGNVYDTLNLINGDIYEGRKDLMQTAYYKNKLPKYEEEIASGIRKVVSFEEMKYLFAEFCRKHNIENVYAHNIPYDYNSLNKTSLYLTGDNYFFPNGLTFYDTNTMTKQVVKDTASYRKFCEKHNFLTSTGKPQTKAEIVYRYLTDNPDFVEEHTGLADVMIEKEILAYCYKKHKKMNGIYHNKEVWFTDFFLFFSKNLLTKPGGMWYNRSENPPPAAKFYHTQAILSSTFSPEFCTK